MQRVPIEAEYLSNPSDIIDEEEYEDSEEEKEFNERQKDQGKILAKVTADDLIDFAQDQASRAT